jgi:hypothetical protein
MKKTKNIVVRVLALLLLMETSVVVFVFAGYLNTLSDSMSSVKVNTLSNHAFTFVTPTGVGSGQTIILTFPANFSIPAGLTYADVNINIGGAYVGSSTLASAPSGATIGVARTSANVLTITNGTSTIAASSSVYIRIGTNAIHQSVGTFQITNDNTTGNKAIGITGDFGDVGTTTVNLINDDNVVVNAIVPESFTFSISSNSINFGNLSASFPKYASSTNANGDTSDTVAHTLSISTNATAGYAITIQGDTLTSQQRPADTISPIGSIPATSSSGSEQFGIYATKSGGVNGVIDSTFATPSSFGFDSTATSSSIFATGSSPTGTSEVYSLHYLANISALTEAGVYSSSLVYVATSNY